LLLYSSYFPLGVPNGLAIKQQSVYHSCSLPPAYSPAPDGSPNSPADTVHLSPIATRGARHQAEGALQVQQGGKN
jgi:hypothetical protein